MQSIVINVRDADQIGFHTFSYFYSGLSKVCYETRFLVHNAKVARELVSR